MNPCDRILRGFECILNDEDFKINSPKAKCAIETAQSLMSWSSREENVKELATFAEMLVGELKECFVCPPRVKSAHSKREVMWKAYHKLTTSQPFAEVWNSFVSKSISLASCPIFYQYVTERIFDQLIKEKFPISISACTETIASLSYIEKNALRYAAGYIPRSLCKKMKKSSDPDKLELLLCIDDMLQGIPESDESQEWIGMIDCGGLLHVSNEMYMVVTSMEVLIHQELQQDVTQVPSFKDKILKAIISNEDVLFYWCILSAPWEVEPQIEEKLLRLVAGMWVTIRGFSYSSAWIEKYKQEHKKTTEKSKGIRKVLQTR